MSPLKPLEDSILERYQFLLEEFDASNNVSELVLGFVERIVGLGARVLGAGLQLRAGLVGRDLGLGGGFLGPFLYVRAQLLHGRSRGHDLGGDYGNVGGFTNVGQQQ